jgi:hypothetical protein
MKGYIGYALYLIGAPGVGKSALMAELLAEHRALGTVNKKPFAHVAFPGGLYLGDAERPNFPGTDALSMAVQPQVEDFITESRPLRIVAEGDRLANDKFFQFLRRTGYHLTVAYLTAEPRTLAARRRERGSNQNPTWMRGRESKSERLANQWAQYWLQTDATPTVELAKHPPFPTLQALDLSLLTIDVGARSAQAAAAR